MQMHSNQHHQIRSDLALHYLVDMVKKDGTSLEVIIINDNQKSLLPLSIIINDYHYQ